MYLPAKFWSALAYVGSFVTTSPFHEDVQQKPLPSNTITTTGEDSRPGFPNFPPPGGSHAPDEPEFNCTYPEMKGWIFCSTPEDRECWLRHPNGSRFDIHTDYETKKPIGEDRYYDLTITDGQFNADGIMANYTKLVNRQYPGPWIQACWGDRIHIRVKNKLDHNGTAIHWHGLRMLNEMHADGVPGVTQCPIAPNDFYTYSFDTRQYGSSWYHSHYSVQYADGLLGPITIHGPSTAPWDEAKRPTIMTDWFHNSAYQSIHNKAASHPTILLNGRGDAARFYPKDHERHQLPYKNPPEPYTLTFEKQVLCPIAHRPKRYLLRLINTSFTTTFVFSIDHHMLQVISADFVPIIPYSTTHILVGIGQRYNVVVEGRPIAYPADYVISDDNFWIRTTVAPCFRIEPMGHLGYDRIGVLRYNKYSKENPRTSEWPEIKDRPLKCRDELMENLKPKVPWNVTLPANSIQFGNKLWGQEFGVKNDSKAKDDPKYSTTFPLAEWSLSTASENFVLNPFQINYGNPMIRNLQNLTQKDWPVRWVVVPANYPENSWIYLALEGTIQEGKKTTVKAHPIHLHGHDFAILQQEHHKELNDKTFRPVLINPPRRDVVLLPEDGFVVIAFKADNPGSWIMHCHIAFHASQGLALQILESQEKAHNRYAGGPELKEVKRVCDKWNLFEKDCTQWWPGWDEKEQCYPACSSNKSDYSCLNHKLHIFQDDSGI